MTTKLVINSDDFGYSRAINYGIIDCYNHGVLTSTTLMANMPEFEHAVKLSKKFPGLGVGAHLVLTAGKPIKTNHSTLIDSSGNFFTLDYLKENSLNISLEEVYDEWDAQIMKILNCDISITHLDTHHYVHSISPLHDIIEKLSKKYSLPVRNCFGVKEKMSEDAFVPASELWNLFNYSTIKDVSEPYEIMKDEIFELLREDMIHFSKLKKVEAVCHPGYLDMGVWLGSSFNKARMREIEILCDPKLKDMLDSFDYELCRYNNF